MSHPTCKPSREEGIANLLDIRDGFLLDGGVYYVSSDGEVWSEAAKCPLDPDHPTSQTLKELMKNSPDLHDEDASPDSPKVIIPQSTSPLPGVSLQTKSTPFLELDQHVTNLEHLLPAYASGGSPVASASESGAVVPSVKEEQAKSNGKLINTEYDPVDTTSKLSTKIKEPKKSKSNSGSAVVIHKDETMKSRLKILSWAEYCSSEAMTKNAADSEIASAMTSELNAKPSAFMKQSFKTELCVNYMNDGNCRYKQHCHFAHGTGELRPRLRRQLYKVRICDSPSNTKLGRCFYTSSQHDRCNFCHPGEAIRGIGSRPYYDDEYEAFINEEFPGCPFPYGVYV